MTESTLQGGASIAHDWWRRLNPTDGHQSGPHRAALARLRRAATPTEVMLEPEALRLVARLPRRPDRAAVLAGVLAFVRETDDHPVARAIGRSSLDDEQSALVSEGRFRRLLQTREDELLEAMRRLVRQMKGRVHVPSLSHAILWWGSDRWEKEMKKEWIFDYYNVFASSRSSAGTSAPSAPIQTTP